MTENVIITQTKSKLENYEKGFNLIQDLIVDVLKQDSLKGKFTGVGEIIHDIKTSIESMSSIHQEDAYLKEYFNNKFDRLKKEALHLLTELPQAELRIGTQKAQEYIQENTEWVKKTVQESPILATSIAFTVGLFISNLMRKK